ncbi:hypothetical protein GQ53DRAFT_413456 [Thozetella sp. PMI_491]|nr:hypothetical protein GQ53DRAFT_413456 [Thozetella sp. PMI_491]
MAGLNLYDVVINTFTKNLKTLDHILTKAEEFAKEKGLDVDAEFPNARLVEDQNPFTFQIQNATKNVKVTLGRLTGQEYAPFEDKEKTITDLRKRVQETLDLLKAVDAATVNARQDEKVNLPWKGSTIQFSVADAALNQGVPNVYFHVVTAYSILRAKGVPVGKADYLGAFLA